MEQENEPAKAAGPEAEGKPMADADAKPVAEAKPKAEPKPKAEARPKAAAQPKSYAKTEVSRPKVFEPKADAKPIAAAKPMVSQAKRDRPTKATAGSGKPLDPTGRGGNASIFAGVAIIAPVLIRELTSGSDPYLLLPITLVLLAVALGGLKVAQGGREGKIGKIGVLVAAAGAALLTVMLCAVAYADLVNNTQLQRGQNLVDLSFYALVVGIVLFGAASLQAGVLARGPMLLFMLALPLGIFFDLVGAFANRPAFQWGPSLRLGAGLHLGLKVMGLSLIWLGYSILKATKAKVDASKAEVKAG